MSVDCTASDRCTAARTRKSRRSLGRAVLRCIDSWYDRWQQRRLLETLSPEALADIGLTPDQVRQEAAKPFWQI